MKTTVRSFTTYLQPKKAMKEHNAKGYITKVYANGDWVNYGEILLKGNNKTFVANSKQISKSY